MFKAMIIDQFSLTLITFLDPPNNFTQLISLYGEAADPYCPGFESHLIKNLIGNIRFRDREMLQSDVIGDVHLLEPEFESPPDRRNNLGVVPDEDLVDGSVRAEQPELLRDPVVDEGFPEHGPETPD